VLGQSRRRAATGTLNIPDASVLCVVSEVPVMRPISATVSSQAADAEDEALAVLHRLPLLISARYTSTVTTVARRVHVAAFGPAAPFVAFPAAELLEHGEEFAEQWSLLMEAAAGGSILITDVEEIPRAAQPLLVESLNRLRTFGSVPTARLMTGTTVSLLERVKAGRFSQDLLYRLNVIHLHRGEGQDPCPECAARG
jgi:transcriptional regulator of aromatic amino acid metabolism